MESIATTMVSRHVFELCTSPTTLISELAKNPNQPVSGVAKQLSKNHGALFKQPANVSPAEDEEDTLGIVRRPSDLFLQIYRDALHTLDADPLAGLVSPSLLGSSGVIPLSIVSVIPDIMRHYAELIVRAEAEIFLATNYWEISTSSRTIADALRQLSKRVEARGGEKVVVKLLYDRGNLKQAVKHRIVVKPVYWSRLGLPTEDEIPGVALEAINYHRPLLGTFHAKYLVVDRRVACLNSNNVQDRPNVEMMVQLEGPVVDSIYDMALLSWSNAMNPPPPLLTKSPTYPSVYKFQQDNEDLRYIDPEAMSKATLVYLKKRPVNSESQGSQPDPQCHNSMGAVAAERKRTAPFTRYRNFPTEDWRGGTVGSHSDVTMLSRKASAKSNANSSIRAWTLDGSAGVPLGIHIRSDSPAPDHPVLDACGSVMPVVNSSVGHERGIIGNEEGDGDTCSDFRPHILHEPHQPVPIAIVNRCPTGSPGHYQVGQFPQDVAWISAMRYAKRSVFIQTPTFNASPIVSSTLDACKRGVQVTLYLDLGFNDQGEMIPFQGGTNEDVVHRMYIALNSEGNGAEKHLEVFWYTSKDQTKPLNAAIRKRNCHVKFMAVDDRIAILGSGNQDTQSWFHSQEVNVMVDSPELVSEWLRGINANQNTRLYGRVSDKDGIWRGEDGEIIQASGVGASTFIKRLKGLLKVIGRVRGTGGF
ncbi:hypothetical protein BJV77DRAFT_1020825 [Russula vinacea]|nr:hypothetical protein BJV77DRAFT_1020825 [Russula vinacea]